MNELPKVGELPDDYREHQASIAHRIGVEALERELHGEATSATVVTALHVNGRMVSTTMDVETVSRILRIFAGLE